MKKLTSVFIALIISLLVVSCHKPKGDEPKAVAYRSVLIYMAANNSLNHFAKNNLEDLRKNYSEGIYKDCNLIVYYHGSGNNVRPKLLKISNTQELEIIKEYEEHNSADKDVMTSIIKEFKSLFPANSYGCVLWSHGTGWLPKSFTGIASLKSNFQSTTQSLPEDKEIGKHPLYKYIRKIDYPETRAFGQDGSNWMEIEDVEDALNDNEFDFIIFDACYMGSIEVIYSLRSKTKWMLASPTEVLGDGLQYNTFAKHAFNKSSDYVTILKDISLDFSKKYNGEATTAIYDMSKIEKFTADYKQLMSTIPDKIGSVTPYNIQRYDRFQDHVLFDLAHYISKITNDKETVKIQQMLDELIVYKYAPSSMLYIPITNYSGISTYAPFESYNAVTPFYKNLRWWNNVLKQK